MVSLGIETSGTLCSVAWIKKTQILLEYNIEIPNIHTTLLPDLVQKGFSNLNMKPTDLNLIAVAAGPGSFTGLRIGMAYAKGLGYALDIPVTAVSNFEILAEQSLPNRFPVYAVIDARRENYFVGIFKNNSYTIDHIQYASGDKLVNILDNKGIIVTSMKTFPDEFKVKIDVIHADYSAAILAKLGYVKYTNGVIDNIDQLEPIYVREFSGTP
jgi:tRNA threonylcarbamoyladenosine biosynthesis protein TsaB